MNKTLIDLLNDTTVVKEWHIHKPPQGQLNKKDKWDKQQKRLVAERTYENNPAAGEHKDYPN